MIAAAGVPVAVHAFLDGRDVPPKSARGQIAALEAALPRGGAHRHGDRAVLRHGPRQALGPGGARRWRRCCAARARGRRAPAAAIEAAYARGETDEFVTPTVIGDYAGARDGDGLFFANFRADRARQILGALLDPGFDGFAVRRGRSGRRRSGWWSIPRG